jgi:hypothetical protein
MYPTGTPEHEIEQLRDRREPVHHAKPAPKTLPVTGLRPCGSQHNHGYHTWTTSDEDTGPIGTYSCPGMVLGHRADEEAPTNEPNLARCQTQDPHVAHIWTTAAWTPGVPRKYRCIGVPGLTEPMLNSGLARGHTSGDQVCSQMAAHKGHSWGSAELHFWCHGRNAEGIAYRPIRDNPQA